MSRNVRSQHQVLSSLSAQNHHLKPLIFPIIKSLLKSSIGFHLHTSASVIRTKPRHQPSTRASHIAKLQPRTRTTAYRLRTLPHRKSLKHRKPIINMLRTLLPRHLPRTRPTTITLARPLSTTTPLAARKGAEDKDSLQPSRSEQSLTGTDNAAAANEDAAFNPNKTRPEEEVDTAGKNKKDNPHGGNPLDVSPGNQEVSQPKPGEGREVKGKERGPSGGGSAPKSGGGESG